MDHSSEVDRVCDELTAETCSYSYHGAEVEVFSLEETKDDCPYVVGNYGESQKPCHFFTNEYSEDNLKDYQEMAKLSEDINNLILLKPAIVSQTLDKKLVVIGYHFLEAYEVWYPKNAPVRFIKNDSVLNSWLAQQIKNVFTLMLESRRKGIILGDLSNPSRYVISRDKLCIVQPRKVTCKTDNFEDLMGFKKFLENHTKHNFASAYDWSNFLDLFPTALSKLQKNFSVEKRIKQLRNHPLLKDMGERLKHFHILWDMGSKDLVNLNHALANSEPPQEFKPWDTKFGGRYGTVYNDVYNAPLDPNVGKKIARYDGEKILDLGRYLRNLIKHYWKSGTIKWDVMGADINRFFPGYSSYFHYAFSRASTSFPITEGLD